MIFIFVFLLLFNEACGQKIFVVLSGADSQML